MRKLPALFLPGLFALLQSIVVAQQVPPSWTPTQDGGVTQTLQSIYIPPLLGAPFSAIVHTEWTRPLPGGGSYTVVNQRKVARDSQGRIYEERWLLVPRDSRIKSQMNVIQIADPNKHTLYNCFVLGEPRRCILQRYAESLMTSYTPPGSVPPPATSGNTTTTHENLGAQYIQGVYTTGIRDTTTVKAGVSGNDRPMITVREFWNAPSLGINLVSRFTSPLTGTQVFTLTDVSLDAPDPSLFEVPAGLEIVDRRRQPSPQQ
ncbi:MAG TPA: hypothetical protein VGS10_11875 [Terracidiphilus sp.]|nr:hypothetical protein [Terracidiphilus sp.]